MRFGILVSVAYPGDFDPWPHVPEHLSTGRGGIQDQLRISLRRPSLSDGTRFGSGPAAFFCWQN